MNFDHEKLDVYRISLEFVAWSYNICSTLNGMNRHARDQLLRASQSIPLNIAEGNGRRIGPDRKRFFTIARGSAFECAAIIDVLYVSNAIKEKEAIFAKKLLHRIVSMLTRLSPPQAVKEESISYNTTLEEQILTFFSYSYSAKRCS